MIDSDSDPQSDLVELLAGNAMGDLDDGELQSLARYFEDEDFEKGEDLHLTAGALHLAFLGQRFEPMPASLRDKIAAAAPGYLPLDRPSVSPAPMNEPAPPNGVSRREQLAWLVTAASILFAIGLWASNRESSTIAVLSPAEARAKLVEQVSDRVLIEWTSGTTPFDEPVAGDVVWSNSLQQGFLRFVGMPINDPSVQQYQLWIIDPARDDEPIDGGVFNVASEGEVIVPIDAKLTVVDPAAFAVTIEKPGGVVVSDQKRLPLLAKVADARG